MLGASDDASEAENLLRNAFAAVFNGVIDLGGMGEVGF